MSEIQSFPWHEAHSTTHCWALWAPDIPCPNPATWRVQNTTNRGYSLMCDVHKDGFATEYPCAAVRYLPVPPQEERR